MGRGIFKAKRITDGRGKEAKLGTTVIDAGYFIIFYHLIFNPKPNRSVKNAHVFVGGADAAEAGCSYLRPLS